MMFSDTLATHYRALKTQSADCILLMQVGAFMRVMDADAYTLARVVGLRLERAGDEDNPVVLGGFPLSGLDLYVGKLVRSGLSVSIALQDENKELRITECVRVQNSCGDAC
ncbi:MAG: hypothetical protein HQM00_15850 [Magnetococcales bacterium]|nr:hypothetical protein [Magnetococcales bacterium]